MIKKILIVRFSSIGDIVLTTPIVRCTNSQLKKTEIHFVTKSAFKEILHGNPNIDKLHTFEKDISEIYTELKNEKFDFAWIDGRDRLRSAEAAIHSIKIGGFISVHDFWKRKKYER